MTTREIITIPDPLLREVSKPVEQIDERLNALIDDMFETMYDAPGIGLAAIQIALPRRIVVVDSTSAWVDVGGENRIAVDSTGFRVIEQQIVGGVPHATIELEVPDEVLLGLSDIFVERPTPVLTLDTLL